jgi:RNA polymerase sigma factor (TIGR02999 family)
MNESVTRILAAVERGDGAAARALLPLVYEELRRLASQRLAHERPGQTLQATALVHEACLRLVDADQVRQWNGRGHFFAAAAEAMRRILVEEARRRARIRHGGGRQRIDLDALGSEHPAALASGDADNASPAADDLLALNDAPTRFTGEEPAAAELVKLRYFTGVTIEEAAAVMNISVRTANRHWAYAKAWLYDQLADEHGEPR